jgi:alpha-glucosidase
MLAFYKRALALRRRLSQWVDTSIAWRPAPDGVLVYKRGRLTVACNFLQRPVAIPASGTIAVASAELAGLKDGRLTLPASSAVWVDSLGS